MSWIQIKLFTNKELVEEWSDLLLETGACAVTLHDKENQAIFEPNPGDLPLWEQVQLIALYPEDAHVEFITLQLKELLGKDIVLQIENIAEQDWQNTWKENLQPMHFGNNLWICPSWCTIPDQSAINIILDPGMAFGTGTHPTTALCLEWLAANMHANNTVIDFGCGSGILGIAAAKLGASVVYCIDCDPQALLSTTENANRNSIPTSQLQTMLNSGHQYQQLAATKVDTVVANILANPLTELATLLANHVKPGGNIVLSGLLTTQADDIIATYSQWFENLAITTKDEWVRITGRKLIKV